MLETMTLCWLCTVVVFLTLSARASCLRGCLEAPQCSVTSDCPRTWTSPEIGATCMEGSCQCLNNFMRDPCSCLSIIGRCHIRSEAPNAVASATYEGRIPSADTSGYTTYSCVANDNCDNEVHVVGNYESDGPRVFEPGLANLRLTVTGRSSRPLVLVLTSYEAVEWVLDIPVGVVIDRVVISSYLQTTSVTYPPGQVSAIENDLRLFAFGSDLLGGGETHQLLQYLYERFGPVTSFTGTYQADEWRLNINRRDPDIGCLSAPFQLPNSSVPTNPPFTPSMPAGMYLTDEDVQCIANVVLCNPQTYDFNAINNCLEHETARELCSEAFCVSTLDDIIAQCGRPDYIETSVCGAVIVSPSSTMATLPSGGVLVMNIILLLFTIRNY